jgi:uncharacterized protein (DUF608 family)
MRLIHQILAGILLVGVSSAWALDKGHLVPVDKNLSPAWLASLSEQGGRRPYRGAELETIGMPCGGIGAGQLYVRGDGTLAQWWIANNSYGTAVWWNPSRPEIKREIRFETPLGPYQAAYRTYRPPSYIEQGFAIRVKSEGSEPILRTLDHDGFDDIRFYGEYPIATIVYTDEALPVCVTSEVFSPFIPLNARDSALPATILAYTVKNISPNKLEVALGGWLQNMVCIETKNMTGKSRNVALRHDDMTMIAMDLAPDVERTSGPFSRIMFEGFEAGDYNSWIVEGEAFGVAPASGTLPSQQTMSGFEGKGFVNTYLGGSDKLQGTLLSPPFTVRENYITFLIGSGDYKGKTCINLLVDEEVQRTSTGERNTILKRKWWDVSEFLGKTARIQIVDRESRSWGHIAVDDIEFCNQPPEPVFSREHPQFGNMTLAVLDSEAGVTADWQSKKAMLDTLRQNGCISGSWESEHPLGEKLCGALSSNLQLQPGQQARVVFILTWHFPNRHYHGGAFNLGQLLGKGNRVGQMYGNWFNSSQDTARYVARNFQRLDNDTRLFRDTYYDTSLPYWFAQRISMPVANLASETCQWWENGRFYGWEGVGSCEGTCTHVWHYEQALGRLFPELARSIREHQNLNPEAGFSLENGGIDHRGGLVGRMVATDGHCGVVLACLREAQMSADTDFLQRNWPRIKLAVQYLIAQDGNEDGIIENRQPNTYDISFYGANSFSGSLYLASLRAGEEMANKMGDTAFAHRCRYLFEVGQRSSIKRLYNGEYFIQEASQERHYKYQYNEGCLSDQLIGQGWAHQVGLGYLYPPKLVQSALTAVWKYNWAPDVGPHNALHQPEIIYADAGEAGLFLCTWPHSTHLENKGVRYRNTVWSGIEGQVASHMLYEGMTTEGLSLMRAIHERHDGVKHNPWNQLLCGDHYARAMSSWGCLITASGNIYDGPAGLIGFAPRITPNDFKSFFSAAEGWGNLSQKRQRDGQTNVIEVKWGKLRVRKLVFGIAGSTNLKKTILTVAGRTRQPAVHYYSTTIEIELPEMLEVNQGEAITATMEW